MPRALSEAEKHSYLCDGKWFDFLVRHEKEGEWTFWVGETIGIARDKDSACEAAHRIIETKQRGHHG